MKREDSFDTLVTDHAPNHEGFVNAAALAGDTISPISKCGIFFFKLLLSTASNISVFTGLSPN
jgi:hypothetical protein